MTTAQRFIRERNSLLLRSRAHRFSLCRSRREAFRAEVNPEMPGEHAGRIGSGLSCFFLIKKILAARMSAGQRRE